MYDTRMLLACWIAAQLSQTRDPVLAFDHVWIAVFPDARERDALEKAGFLISKETVHQEGQGTASITVEFQNAYLELIWPDSGVSVDPGLEKAAASYRLRMMWHTSGWCPFGLAFRWSSPTDSALPVPSHTVSLPWLPNGAGLQVLTPKDDLKSPLLFVSPRELTDPEVQAGRAAQYPHPIGVGRVTAIRLVSPQEYKPIPALAYLTTQTQLTLGKGDQWLLEITFDGGKQKLSKDLRPELPLVIRY